MDNDETKERVLAGTYEVWTEGPGRVYLKPFGGDVLEIDLARYSFKSEIEAAALICKMVASAAFDNLTLAGFRPARRGTMIRRGPDGKLVVYVLHHPQVGFSGVVAGIDFCDGKGSTSSLEDTTRLVALGYHVEDPAAQAEAEGANVSAQAKEGQQSAGRDALDAIERAPGYMGTKRAGRR